MIDEILDEPVEKSAEETVEIPAAEKEQISEQANDSRVLMTIGESTVDPNLVQASVAVISAADTGIPAPDSNRVMVQIKYPAKWKGDKFYQDGDIVTVSRESALRFIELSIASLVQQDKSE